MARPRSADRAGWPPGLREPRPGYFVCRTVSGCDIAIGRVPLPEAITMAEGIRHRRVMPLPDDDPADIARMKFLAYSRAQARARKNGWEIMSREEYDTLWRRAARRCELTRIPFRPRPPDYGPEVFPWTASIDRLDGSKGYESGNCRLVCAAVNIALNQFGEEVFAEIAHGIFTRRIGI